MKLDFEKAVKDGVDQAMREYELTIGMTVKEAVEKQIPKKVVFVPDACLCPRCGFDMMGVYDFVERDTKDPSFCPNCGQKLDWGDAE